MTLQYCFDGSAKKVNNPSVSSPRTWGCFCTSHQPCEGQAVFPTHVGVFPSTSSASRKPTGLPHARGGVSTARGPYRLSPSLPHARGGVSMSRLYCSSFMPSSPRTWGCFHKTVQCQSLWDVFPTHVGVFPILPCTCSSHTRLPHARGGVSAYLRQTCPCLPSSPRTWGCF